MKKILYISAGAGSGKTTKIVNELVAILKNNQGKIKTSDIMMTTFSRAAAFEMRERTRIGLLKNGMIQEASELDAASIGTIHSVCLKFLQKYWYLAGISPEPKQLEENDFNMFANNSINESVSENDMRQFETWRKQLNLTKAYGEPDTTYWYNLLRKMVEKVRYYNIADLNDSRQCSIDEIRECFANHQFVRADYNLMKDQYIADNETDKKKDNTLSANAEKRLAAINSYDPVASGFENFPKTTAKCVQEISRKMELYVKASKVFTVNLENTLVGVVNKLFDILQDWMIAFDEYKKKNHLLDYNDMELLFKELLAKQEVRDEIASRYKLIMVDEYQDCNTIQVDIFEKLSDLVAVNSPLDYASIWVGDPKQAIYGFRGSDTELTNSKGKEIHIREDANEVGFKTDALDKSFRSRAGLVELANDIFLPIFSGSRYGMIEKEITLQSGRLPGATPEDKVNLNQKTALHWQFGQSTKEGRHMALARQIQAMVESQKYEVQSKKDDSVHPLQYEDIAVLCRNNKTVAQLANCMLKLGMPVCAPESDIFSRIEVQLMLSLLQYAKEPKYRSHLRLDIIHILKNESTESILNEFAEYTLSDKIETVKKDDKEYKVYDWRSTDELIKLVETISKECYAKNMHDTLATFVDRLRLLDVVNRWGNAEIRKDNIINLLKKAAQYDTHCEQIDKLAYQQVFSKFSQYLIDSDNKSDLDLDRKAVKVLTYHKSKGLDWPMVVLYELNNEILTTPKIAEWEYTDVREQKKSDETYWLRVFPPMGKVLDDDVAEILSGESYFDTAYTRLQKEEARLFYVGVTRARDILVFATEYSEKKGKPKDAPPIITIKTQWMDEILRLGADNSGMTRDDLLYALHEECFTLGNNVVVENDKYQEIDTSKLEIDVLPNPHLLNPSKVKGSQSQFNVSVIDIPDASFSVKKTDEKMRMSTIGSCIHNIYAAYNPVTACADSYKMAEGVIKAYGLEQVIQASDVINAIKLLYDKLRSMFGEPLSIKHEVPFSLPMTDDQLLHGEIDLLWETIDGVVLVDFKSIESETPNPEHYFAQMSAYERAINAAKQKCHAIVLFYANHGKMVVLNR